MSNRKETPDVLGALLGGAPVPDASPTPAPAPAPAQPKRTSTPRKMKAPAKDASPKVTAAAAQASPLPTPPQWEYLEVVFRDYRGWRPMQENGREQGNWKDAPLIQEYLKQLGEAGWELVSMGDRHNNQKEAYFKRIKR